MNEIKNLGLPYMGSKRKLAPKIIKKILSDNSNTKYFYDLFGGGGAISFYISNNYPDIKVFYNEYNKGVVELLKKIKKDEITKEFYNFIDRESFIKNKDKDDWIGGLSKTVYSFGNNQKSYLYGKEIELYKYLLHKIIIDNSIKHLEEFNKKYDMKLNLSKKDDIRDRKLEISKEIRKILKEQNNIIKRLFQVEHLDRLKNLENLKNKINFEILNYSYDEVKIKTPINETIIYLDPPYKNTGKYQKDIDHNKLKDYIHSSHYTIYLSSYENVYDMYLVDEYEHRSSLSSTANNKVIEKLYCNRKIENKKNDLF